LFDLEAGPRAHERRQHLERLNRAGASVIASRKTTQPGIAFRAI
jgi:hypothetical protein